ncbi:MAG: phage major capsid protein [Selenomonadaceae bacterium]|nr:phage major capsid protein [Selenomonadaceae bacterium]
MNLNEMIKKLEERKAALVARSEKSEDISELRSINTQLQQINGDIADLRAEQAKADEEKRAAEEAAKKAKEEAEKRAKEEAEKANANDVDERTAAVNGEETPENGEQRSVGGSPSFVPGKGFVQVSENRDGDYAKVFETREKAGAELKENRSVKSDIGIFGELRSVVVGDGSKIAIPDYTGNTINPLFPVVSSLIDGVMHKPLNGGDSFKQAYVKTIDAGDYTSEATNAAEAETDFDYANIKRTKVTAYGEVSKELLKLANAPYADEVFKNIRTSLRIKLTREILLGNGEDNHLTGIFSAKATAIDPATDLSIATIDDGTLDEIVFNYGGSENVEGAAVLILNKSDLLAFAKVRTATKEKFYDIKSNGNFGTINGIPFIINSACSPLSAAATATGAYSMAYGNLQNYMIAEFGDIEVSRSEHAKFREGMICYLGETYAGGNVVAKNGFLRVKKAPAA